MTYTEIQELMEIINFSPEQLGARIGISGMTIRRWASLPGEHVIPPLYQKAFQDLLYELMAEGKIDAQSELVQGMLKDQDQSLFKSTLKGLGFSEDFIKGAKPNTDSLIEGLSQIGAYEKKQESVNRSKKQIFSYTKLGQEWKSRIKTLYEVTRSKKLSNMDKFAAYGALFYLLTPIDLIPDHVPIFGLLDDFFILGLISVYYINRFPELFNKTKS